MAEPTKKALGKAYDAGQAAQRFGDPKDGNPFEDGTAEWESWLDGYDAELDPKWLTRGGRPHTLNISN